MYQEIVKLHQYCGKLGIPCTLEPFDDGYVLQIRNSGFKFSQHRYTEKSKEGYIEPSVGSRLDHMPATLASAKGLVCRNKECWRRLNNGVKEV